MSNEDNNNFIFTCEKCKHKNKISNEKVAQHIGRRGGKAGKGVPRGTQSNKIKAASIRWEKEKRDKSN